MQPKHITFALLCFAAGCSTNPIADVGDYLCPGKMGPNKVQPYGGVNIPQGPIVPPMPSVPGAIPVPGGLVPPPQPLPGTAPPGVLLQPPAFPEAPPPPFPPRKSP